LPQTLTHLAAQQVDPRLPWEIMVVDNASTDETAKTALDCWPDNFAVPLRVINQPEIGLSHARVRALDEAKYELITFIDDDNWVCPGWVQMVADLMSKRAEIGACGGISEACSEISAPWWFETYQEWYAVGPQADHEGDITWSRGYLWGAGLSIRRSAWKQLVELGFRFTLTDRCGTSLCAGGDSELCFALRLLGWRIWYEPQLKICHYLPANRLQWRYLRQILRGIGKASPLLRTYEVVSFHNSRSLQAWFVGNWVCQLSVALLKLIFRSGQLVLALPQGFEGNRAVLNLDVRIGEINQLCHGRHTFNINLKRIRNIRDRIGAAVGSRLKVIPSQLASGNSTLTSQIESLLS
jgi:glycosyltransferase involved in cell wall biosynthesis